MIALVKTLVVVVVAVWLGETVFLSLVAAPVLFSSLPVEQAGDVMTLLFPWYYRVAYLCGTVLIGAGFYLWTRSEQGRGGWALLAGLAATCLVACVYAGVFVQPQAHALREELRRDRENSAVKVRFDALHERAVQLNAGVLLGTLALAGVVGFRLR